MRLRLRQRPTLLAATGVLVAVAGGAALLPGVGLRTAILAGWCAGAATHAALLLWHLVATPPDRLRHHAAQIEDSRWSIIGLTLAASVAALAAVVIEIGGGTRGTHSMTLGVATIAVSWAYLHVLFAVHYAHAYWLAGGGIAFPGGSKRPDWAEFLYLAVTVGMTAQVSDVTTASPAMRRLVLAHGLASFLFNAAIVGLAVNLLAGSAAG
ncbi:DUF1345 domain-containing protein [Roseomonas terrae]|jgi:uncharacterized membrane protein|uniref:DUF1345 domain-containing protein n=1 Tax=Neoroseomonas terrae TaxID=424799 RepID=A0ABS5EPM4_9PROT|nr:DUF1345 domain-containing protein [Neoroseomonas terrae]MBR0652942.1 DUF1345 domain-containing protein [Neoroseomonas terrae]